MEIRGGWHGIISQSRYVGGQKYVNFQSPHSELAAIKRDNEKAKRVIVAC